MIKTGLVITGIVIMALTFFLHAIRKMTVNLAVVWEFLGGGSNSDRCGSGIFWLVPFAGARNGHCDVCNRNSGRVGRISALYSDLRIIYEESGACDAGVIAQSGK